MVEGRHDDFSVPTVARRSIDPSLKTAATLAAVNEGLVRDVGLADLVAELEQQAEAVKGRDLSELEAVLACNVKTLDAAFHQLIRIAFSNLKSPNLVEQYFKLALRAQNQSRMTAETISKIQNPPTLAFVQQANIAQGPQQVNNAVAPRDARGGEFDNVKSELLGSKNGEGLVEGGASRVGKGVSLDDGSTTGGQTAEQGTGLSRARVRVPRSDTEGV